MILIEKLHYSGEKFYSIFDYEKSKRTIFTRDKLSRNLYLNLSETLDYDSIIIPEGLL